VFPLNRYQKPKEKIYKWRRPMTTNNADRKVLIEELIEEIIDCVVENVTCVHDYEPRGHGYPGHHFVEYDVDPKCSERLAKILDEFYNENV
jgi:hypothetical protein